MATGRPLVIPEGKATTLKTAFQACDVGALRGAAQRYYVDLSAIRSPASINSLKTRLDFLDPGQFEAVLFTGHRGCGKSTELLRLKAHLEQEYRVIYLETDDALDINDADYIDLYLVLIRQVMREVGALKLRLDPRLLGNFEAWFKEITQESEESVEKSVSLETEAEAGVEVPFLAKLVVKLLAQIKGSHTQRKTVRTTLQQDIGRLKADMNALLLDAFEKLRVAYPQYPKGFLVMFDNLDRVPPEVGDRLYFDYATQLQDLNCTLIYTVPISVVYSDKNVNNSFSQPHIVPMVNIYQQQDQKLGYNREVLQGLARLITGRMDHRRVFASPAAGGKPDVLVMRLLKASGGHVRQLMQMVAKACLAAASRGATQIEEADVEYVIKQEQFNFERVVPDHHYPLLVQVCEQQRVPQTADGQRMLFNLSVLEYNGDRRWNYINPVIKNCDAFQEAQTQAKTPNPDES